MLIQKELFRKPKTDLYYDLIELFTGITLVIFLWMHTFFVSTILLGHEVFNALSEGLDRYYLPYVGIPFIIIILFAHILTAGRRIPTRYQEQKIILRHARMIKSTDTWIWIFQIITGIAILVLTSIHLWVIITGWPIEAETSLYRLNYFFWFYLVLLLLSQSHAGFGVYRQFVKWGWLPRKPVLVVAITLALGLIILGFSLHLGGAR